MPHDPILKEGGDRQMRGYPRRSFVGLFLALLARPWRTGLAEPPQSSPPNPIGSAPVIQLRNYQANAAILLLGITIFRRADVGGGTASIEEITEGASKRTTFFFAAGSDPKRAHGLNRMGWIKEVSISSGSGASESTYFGVMTSSPEESLEHARKAIDGPQAGRESYSAISGRHTAGHSRSALTHFEFPADTRWSDQRLIDQAQAELRAGVPWRESAWPDANSVPRGFLAELAALLKQRSRHAVGFYVYNEQEYSLELDSAEQGAGAARLVHVNGKVRNLRTGHQTPFQVWIETAPGSIVPVRIDFQPRSYLRLTFEAVAS